MKILHDAKKGECRKEEFKILKKKQKKKIVGIF